MSPDFIEKDGRWCWVVGWTKEDGGRTRQHLEHGVVYFETKADAEEDFNAHVSADSDSTGRIILPKEHIQRMVRAIAEPCEDCKDMYFGGVYWHEPDSTGCNWSVSTMNGPDVAGCLDCLQQEAMQLRYRYAIAGEGNDKGHG